MNCNLCTVCTCFIYGHFRDIVSAPKQRRRGIMHSYSSQWIVALPSSRTHKLCEISADLSNAFAQAKCRKQSFATSHCSALRSPGGRGLTVRVGDAAHKPHEQHAHEGPCQVRHMVDAAVHQHTTPPRLHGRRLRLHYQLYLQQRHTQGTQEQD